MTEITEKKNRWIFYDGNCPFCRRIKNRLERTFEKRGLRWAKIQEPWVRYRTGIPVEELYREMKVLDDEGEVRGGLEAWLYLAEKVWWMYPLYGVGRIRFLKPLLNRFYEFVAENRYCVGGTCEIGER